MLLENLSVSDFRNLKEGIVSLGKGVNIITGENAQGKTNILEAVYLCATGRSHRTNSDKELIEFNKKEAHLKIYVDNDGFKDRVDVHLRKEPKKSKGIAVNSIAIKNYSQLYGIMYVVMFSPEDLYIIKNGPSAARKFVDAEICQINPTYYNNLKNYYKALKHRNALLKDMSFKPSLKDTIFIWDEKLAQYGRSIIDTRSSFIEKLSDVSASIHSDITGGAEKFEIFYRPSVKAKDISDVLSKNIQRDICLKSTSVGPHKDNFLFCINDKDARYFGSQGQQRCAALSLKLSELYLISYYTGKRPLLLLDDVFSELDGKRQLYLMEHIEKGQTVITCTGIEDALKQLNAKKIYTVKDGAVILEE